jgi:aminoglycoside 6'-N-acetyltransferase I
MIRSLITADRTELKTILEKIAQFSSEDVSIAMELIDITIDKTEQDDYTIFVLEEEGKVSGYYCIGLRPLTDGVYDLYWIVIDPDAQGKGLGSSLIEHAEKLVKDKNGRWLLAETSSKEIYTPTRAFYIKNSFNIVTEIKDFYRKGEDLLVYGKYY